MTDADAETGSDDEAATESFDSSDPEPSSDPAPPSPTTSTAFGSIAATVGLLAMVVAFVGDIVSRFIWTVDWLPRFATVTTVVAALCFALGLALTALQGGEDRRLTLTAVIADLVVLVLLVCSLAMRLMYWEPGYGTPLRASAPLAVAIVVAAWSGWRQRQAELQTGSGNA